MGDMAALHTEFETTGTWTSSSVAELSPPYDVVPQPVEGLLTESSTVPTIHPGHLPHEAVPRPGEAGGGVDIDVHRLGQLQQRDIVVRVGRVVLRVVDDLCNPHNLPGKRSLAAGLGNSLLYILQ